MISYILDVNQHIAVENGLDVNDLLILRAILRETEYHEDRKETQDDTYAKWKGEQILELFPIITLSCHDIDKRLTILADNGFLLRHKKDSSYYSISEKYCDLTHGSF